MSYPYLSIVILTKNAGPNFSKTLRSIFSSVPDFTFEVIVIDSGSTDKTIEVALKYPLKLVEIPSSEFGHGKTRNYGATLAQGDVLVFLTQDAVLANKNSLKTIIADFEDDEVAGVYGRQLPNLNSSPLERYFLEYTYPGNRSVKANVNPEKCGLSDIFFSNVYSAIRKSDILQTPFNETLIMSEDQEWAKNILAQGRKIVYCPEATVYHSHKYSLKELFLRNFDSGFSLRGLINLPLIKSIYFEFKFLFSGFVYLLRHRHFLHILIFVVYEFVRLFAFSLGFWGEKLPKSFKRAFSKHKYYWDVV